MGKLRVVVAVIAVLAAAVAVVRMGGQDAMGVPSTTGAPALTVPQWADEDWTVFETKVRWAVDQGLDTASIGRTVAEIGRTFVGTAYVPRTLEVEGPEHLVIDFRHLDCVTFVENALALGRFVKSGGARLLGDRRSAERVYETLLMELRYRGGNIDGYPSRLHYFSDWIADNARRGVVVSLAEELGGVLDTEPVDFMTTHQEAYWQLGEPRNLNRMREAERRLSEAGRYYVPEGRIADVAEEIQDGDVIAATSTVRGLDVAHTGVALWVDGGLHLLHAPLVGEAVQISESTLADRILRIEAQDGILVARPLEP